MTNAFHRLGRYLIVDEIASGGMAHVYRAKLMGVEGFENEVAIKKILPSWSHKKEFVKMLIEEAKILVHLHHGNIVQVIELGKEQDNFFIVMEYVDGYDLKKLLKKVKSENNKLKLDLIFYIIKEICKGLEFAHTRKDSKGEPLHIIHRDISPQNILISHEGEVKITDFGIAKVMGKNKETNTGVLKGKFSYMSPEQALGKQIDERTDLFSLGVLFYEMVFGKKCFEGETDMEIIEKVKTAQVQIPPEAELSVLEMMEKILSKDQSQRYQSAAEFYDDIEACEKELAKQADANELKLFLEKIFQDAKMHSPSLLDKQIIKTKMTLPPLAENSQNKKQDLFELHPDDSFTIVNKDTFIEDATFIEDQKNYNERQSFRYEPGPAPVSSPGKLHQNRYIQIAVLSLPVILILFFLFVGPTEKNENLPPISEGMKHSETEPSTEVDNVPPPVIQMTTPAMDPLAKENDEDQPTPATILQDENSAPLEDEELHVKLLEGSGPINQKSGSIVFRGRPWGHITVGEYGSLPSPSLFELPAGSHDVAIVYPPTGQTINTTIAITEDHQSHCVFLFEKNGSIDCEDEEGNSASPVDH